MKRRIMAVLLTLCMVLSMMPAVTFAAETDFTDTDGHWAESIIEKWADFGVVSGLGNNKFAQYGADQSAAGAGDVKPAEADRRFQ